MEEFENEFDFDFDDDDIDNIFKKRLQFELEYLKNTEWTVNKEQFKIYVACCEAMRKIAEAMGGEVFKDYRTILNGEDLLFNLGVNGSDCECSIIVDYFSLVGDNYDLFLNVLNYSRDISISPASEENINISITVPNVYIDKGITV